MLLSTFARKLLVMFRFLIIGVGLYVLYRMFTHQPLIPGSQRKQPLDHQQESNDDEYVDYEEID